MKNILSENINFSFNSRETGINNNVFFCGSSNNRTSFLESNILNELYKLGGIENETTNC